HGLGCLAARQRTLDDQTARGTTRSGEALGHATQEMLDDAAGGWLLERGVQYGQGPDFGIAVERAAEQRLLISKRRIEAWPVDAHRLGEVGQRCSLETPLPENRERPVECLIGIE